MAACPMRLALYALCLIALFYGQGLAQPDSLSRKGEVGSSSPPSYRSLSSSWSMGVHSYSSKLFRRGLTHPYNALDVRYGFQPNQEQSWASNSGYPSYGIGAYIAFLGDEQRFGRPVSVYGFLNKELLRLGQQRLESAFSLGFAADLTRYTGEVTPILEQMGSRVTVFFDLRLGLALRLTRELDLITGGYFTHMSNGRTFLPNFGLNASGLYLGTRYYYHSKQQLTSAPQLPARWVYSGQKHGSLRPNISSEHSISLYAAGGTVESYVHDAATDVRHKRRFSPMSLLLEYDYHFSPAHALGIGLDYFRDPSLRTQHALSDKAQINMGAVHLGYRYKVWRLSLGLQGGAYVINRGDKALIFLRPSLRYDISSRLFAQVGLKTHNGATADWVEWGLGVKLLRFCSIK